MTDNLTPLAKKEIFEVSIMITSGKLKQIEVYVLTEYLNSLLRSAIRENDPRR